MGNLNLNNVSRKLEKLRSSAPVSVSVDHEQEGLLSDLLPPDERAEYKAFEEGIRDRVDQGTPRPFARLTNDELATLHTWLQRLRVLEQQVA